MNAATAAGEGGGDGPKASKRDRLREALAKTKTRLRKASDAAPLAPVTNFQLDDEVNDFLQGGRDLAARRPSAPSIQESQPRPPEYSAIARRLESRAATHNVADTYSADDQFQDSRGLVSRRVFTAPPTDSQTSKTKAKGRKESGAREATQDLRLDDGVTDFLQGGRDFGARRASTTSGTDAEVLEPSTTAGPAWEGLAAAQYAIFSNDWNPFVQGEYDPTARRPSTASTSDSQQVHTSPRRIVGPKLDVSGLQRWPNAKPVQGGGADDLLQPPQQQARSQSQSSMQRRRRKTRKLSVSFVPDPPVVIGEGGDDAETPPIDVSRRRTRSVSPNFGANARPGLARSLATRRGPTGDAPSPEQGPMTASTTTDEGSLRRPRVMRVQTGLTVAASAPPPRNAADLEFEMTLQTPLSNQPVPVVSPLDDSAGPIENDEPPSPLAEAELNQDKPGEGHGDRRPSLSPSPLRLPRHVKPSMAQTDLRMQFEEGAALRHAYHHQPQHQHQRNLSSASSVVASDTEDVAGAGAPPPYTPRRESQRDISPRPQPSSNATMTRRDAESARDYDHGRVTRNNTVALGASPAPAGLHSSTLTIPRSSSAGTAQQGPLRQHRQNEISPGRAPAARPEGWI